MKIRYSPELKRISQGLRNRTTDAEKLLWSKLRRKQISGFQFFRQRPILNFIVDFYCPKAKLVIGIDGGQHYENRNILKDRERENKLREIGLRILRYNNLEVLKNLDGVIDDIYKNLRILNPP